MKNVGVRLTWRKIHKNRLSCEPLPDGSILIVQGKNQGSLWLVLGMDRQKRRCYRPQG